MSWNIYIFRIKGLQVEFLRVKGWFEGLTTDKTIDTVVGETQLCHHGLLGTHHSYHILLSHI